MEQLAQQVLTVDHWPWVAVVAILTIITQVLSLRVFTREQAYKKRKAQPFWYWMRELLPLQPIALGLLIGWGWPDPESAGWDYRAGMAYFGSAGVLALVAWLLVKAKAKSKGIDLRLPGRDTEPPK